MWIVGSGDASDTYDACAGTPEPSNDITLTVTTDGFLSYYRSLVVLGSDSGPEATDNGDGTFSVTMGAPTENMEYLWVVDGVQENLVDNAANAECTAEIDGGSLITDFAAGQIVYGYWIQAMRLLPMMLVLEPLSHQMILH